MKFRRIQYIIIDNFSLMERDNNSVFFMTKQEYFLKLKIWNVILRWDSFVN